ncbi:MAG: class I SAM-dependent methyltransferase [Acidimicrobiia bacterium]
MPSGHYFEPEPSVGSAPRTVRLDLADLSLALTTDRGVFSADAVDVGTKYLLMNAPAPPATGNFVDLGSGYGPIAITLARRSPAATVWAVDVNQRARALTAANAIANDAPNVIVEEPPSEVAIDLLWSNPPVRIGKAAMQSMLADWLARLAPTGRAVLVVNKNLGADSLASWLRSQGYSVQRLGSRLGFRLLEIRPEPGTDRRLTG